MQKLKLPAQEIVVWFLTETSSTQNIDVFVNQSV